jgi:hypothetical protein
MQYRAEGAPPVGPWGGPPPRGGGTLVVLMFKGETPLDPPDACARLFHLRSASPSYAPRQGGRLSATFRVAVAIDDVTSC